MLHKLFLGELQGTPHGLLQNSFIFSKSHSLCQWVVNKVCSTNIYTSIAVPGQLRCLGDSFFFVMRYLSATINQLVQYSSVQLLCNMYSHEDADWLNSEYAVVW